MKALNRDEPIEEEVGPPALAVAKRRWWVIALTMLFAVTIAALGLSLVTPSYQATVTLQAPITTGAQTPVDVSYIDRLMTTYKQLALQSGLSAEVARELGQRQLPSLSVTIETNTELLQLSATDHSPTVAQRTANVAASVLVARTSALARSASQAGENALSAQLNALTSSIAALRVQLASTPTGAADTARRLALQESIRGKELDYQALVQQRAQLQLADAVHDQTLSIVQPASKPTTPASPVWPPVLALALALGLLGGTALAFSLERFLPRLYTVEAIESAADAAVMAAIPRVTNKPAGKVIYNGGSPAQEAFGVLSVQVLAEAHERRLRTILLTSPSQGDGKSDVAANLAVELARSGHRVLLVDADMRSPSVHRNFGLEATPGLSDLLEGSDPAFVLDEFIVEPGDIPNLGLLLAGSQPAAPARLLASERLSHLIDALMPRYEFLLFDAPPLVVSDPMSIARLVDLVLLVVGGNAVPDRDIQAARRQLSRVGAEHVSIVVNRWRGRETSYSYSYRST